jgi:hypothetical protein
LAGKEDDDEDNDKADDVDEDRKTLPVAQAVTEEQGETE